MKHRLPGTASLITDTVKIFFKTWRVVFPHALLLIFGFIIQNISGVIPNEYAAIRLLALIPTYIIGILLMFWATIRLYQVLFALHDGHTVSKQVLGTALWLTIPFSITAFVVGFIGFVGVLLLILPAIYFGVRLGFVQLAFVEEGTRLLSTPHARKSASFRAIGMAIAESWDRTKGYFWALFGRWLLAGILFIIFIIALIAVLLFIGGGFAALFNVAVDRDSAITTTFIIFVGALVYASFLALPFILQIKLWHALPKQPKTD